MPENIWTILVKKLTKEASAAELQEMEGWFLEHPEDKEMTEELVEYWNTRPEEKLNPNQLFLRHLKRLQAANPTFGSSLESLGDTVSLIRQPSYFKRNFRTILSVAAILIVIGSSGFWAINQHFFKRPDIAKGKKPIINEIQTRPGSRSKIVLPDGSEVWVNSTSRLLYKPDFGKTHRKVQLDGEAYFQVAKNKELPFEIETKRITITVTGTIFNVRAYDDEEKAETSLFEGSVQVVHHQTPEKNYYLKPNQKLVIDESGDKNPIESLPRKDKNLPSAPGIEHEAEPLLTTIAYDPLDSMALETSWLYSTLIFNDESFLEISQKMEKWYGVDMVFQSKKLEKIRFTGRFTNEAIQEALEALQFTARFKFRKEENRMIIY